MIFMQRKNNKKEGSKEGSYLHKAGIVLISVLMMFSVLVVGFGATETVEGESDDMFIFDEVIDEGDESKYSATFSNDGSMLSITNSGGDAQHARIYEDTDGTGNWTLIETLEDSTISVANSAWSENDEYFAYFGWEDDDIWIYDTSDWTLDETLTHQRSVSRHGVFSSDHFIVGGDDGTYTVWDIDTWTVEDTVDPGSDNSYRYGVLTSEGEEYVSGFFGDGPIFVHDTTDWIEQEQLENGGADSVRGIDITDDGDYLFALLLSENDWVRIYKYETDTWTVENYYQIEDEGDVQPRFLNIIDDTHIAVGLYFDDTSSNVVETYDFQGGLVDETDVDDQMGDRMTLYPDFSYPYLAMPNDDSNTYTYEYMEEESVYLSITTPVEGDDIPVWKDLTVEWSSSEVDSYEIQLDDGDWIEKGTNTSHTFDSDKIEVDEYTVTVTGVVEGDDDVSDSVTFEGLTNKLLVSDGQAHHMGRERPLYKEYNNSLYMSYMQSDGQHRISKYDYETEEWSHSPALTDVGTEESHNLQGFFFRDDGRIQIFIYGSFSSYEEDDIRWKVSDNPEDVTEWTEYSQKIDGYYLGRGYAVSKLESGEVMATVNVQQEGDEDSGVEEMVLLSEDDGETWDTHILYNPQPETSDIRGYNYVDTCGDYFHLTPHRLRGDDPDNPDSVNYLKFDVDTMSYYSAGGEKLLEWGDDTVTDPTEGFDPVFVADEDDYIGDSGGAWGIGDDGTMAISHRLRKWDDDAEDYEDDGYAGWAKYNEETDEWEHEVLDGLTWENPNHFQINRDNPYQMIAPAVYGDDPANREKRLELWERDMDTGEWELKEPLTRKVDHDDTSIGAEVSMGYFVYDSDKTDTSTIDVVWTDNWYAGMREHDGELRGRPLYFEKEDEPDPLVETNPATDVTDNSATLPGELTDMGGESSVNVFFRYREDGETTWQETSTDELTQAEDYEISITGLEEETTYEYMAVVQWNSEDTGNIETFTTSTDDDVGDDDGDDDDLTDPDDDVKDEEALTLTDIGIISAVLIGVIIAIGYMSTERRKGGGGTKRS